MMHAFICTRVNNGWRIYAGLFLFSYLPTSVCLKCFDLVILWCHQFLLLELQW